MNGKYQPRQKVFLTGGNKILIKEATVLKYTGFYTIRFNNGGGIKVRESRIYSSREESEAAILTRKRQTIGIARRKEYEVYWQFISNCISGLVC